MQRDRRRILTAASAVTAGKAVKTYARAMKLSSQRVPTRVTALLALAFLATACASAGSPSAAPPNTTPTGAAATPTDRATRPPGVDNSEPPAAISPAPGSIDPAPATPAALPSEPWRTLALRDVRSGEEVRINDLAGRLVVIEPMAIWCTSCLTQQNEAREALASLDRDDIVYISLDVDPNETEPDLARYADERGYPWHFMVASREVASSLAETFGDQVLSPPSTPKIVVNPDGAAEIIFGIKRAGELEADFAARLP